MLPEFVIAFGDVKLGRVVAGVRTRSASPPAEHIPNPYFGEVRHLAIELLVEVNAPKTDSDSDFKNALQIPHHTKNFL